MVPKICSFPECPNRLLARGFCSGHYKQERRVGRAGMTPLAGKHLTTSERFNKNFDETSGCWTWRGASANGYGVFHFNRKNVSAHRFSYEQSKGEIPEGMMVDHMCHNTLCVNPLHLQIASREENGQNRIGPNTNTTSGVRGVSWNSNAKKYMAYATSHGKRVYGGLFSELDDAAQAAILIRNQIQTNNLIDRNQVNG